MQPVTYTPAETIAIAILDAADRRIAQEASRAKYLAFLAEAKRRDAAAGL